MLFSPKSPLSSTAGLNNQHPKPKLKWKLTAKYRSEFPPFFTVVYIDEQTYGTYLLGGGCTSDSEPIHSCMQYVNKKLEYKKPMP